MDRVQVPTIYVQLIEEYTRSSPEQQRRMSESLAQFRLMVRGSHLVLVYVLFDCARGRLVAQRLYLLVS